MTAACYTADMNNTTRQTEQVHGSQLRVGDTIIRQGYEWVIDSVTHEPGRTMTDGSQFVERYCCSCHWAGAGVDPQFFNDGFNTAQRADLLWTRLV